MPTSSVRFPYFCPLSLAVSGHQPSVSKPRCSLCAAAAPHSVQTHPAEKLLSCVVGAQQGPPSGHDPVQHRLAQRALLHPPPPHLPAHTPPAAPSSTQFKFSHASLCFVCEPCCFLGRKRDAELSFIVFLPSHPETYHIPSLPPL